MGPGPCSEIQLEVREADDGGRPHSPEIHVLTPGGSWQSVVSSWMVGGWRRATAHPPRSTDRRLPAPVGPIATTSSFSLAPTRAPDWNVTLERQIKCAS